MAKETGYANFTPEEAKEFQKQEAKNQPQGPKGEIKTKLKKTLKQSNSKNL